MNPQNRASSLPANEETNKVHSGYANTEQEKKHVILVLQETSQFLKDLFNHMIVEYYTIVCIQKNSTYQDISCYDMYSLCRKFEKVLSRT